MFEAPVPVPVPMGAVEVPLPYGADETGAAEEAATGDSLAWEVTGIGATVTVTVLALVTVTVAGPHSPELPPIGELPFPPVSAGLEDTEDGASDGNGRVSWPEETGTGTTVRV